MLRVVVRVLIGMAGVAAVGAIVIGLGAVSRPPAPVPAQPSSAQDEAVPPSAMTQSNHEGEVQVQVTRRPDQAGSGAISFEVSLNTHSVELGQFDLIKLTQLTLEPGGTLTPASWETQSPEGHHVSGLLTFWDPDGLLGRAEQIRLEIRDLAAVPVRQFEWQGAVR